MPIVALNKEFIANSLTIPPEKSRIEYCCSTTPGLYVEVRSTSPNEGTYYYRHKVDGKSTHTKLGRTTEIDLNEARQLALDRRNHFINNRHAPEPKRTSPLMNTSTNITSPIRNPANVPWAAIWSSTGLGSRADSGTPPSGSSPDSPSRRSMPSC